MYVATVDYKTQ